MVDKLTRILTVAGDPKDAALVLAKSIALARQFGARVELLLSEPAHADEFARLCASLAYDEVTLSSVHQGAEPLHEAILKRVLATRPDLVIKSPAGSHPLRRFTFDDNDWRLANECLAPLLLVRHKPWAEPMRFAAAVDVADEDTAELARSILHSAGFMALGCHGILDILYSERERHDAALRMKRAVTLAQLVREYHVGSERIQVLSGLPEQTLPPLVAAREYDVLVLGAQTREPSLASAFRSTTSRLVEATEGDVVLVKAPAHRSARNLERPASNDEQRSHEAEQFV